MLNLLQRLTGRAPRRERREPQPFTDAIVSAILQANTGAVANTTATAAGWGDGQSAAPHKDWIANRLGPNPPTAMNTTRRESFGTVLAACGVPPDLMDVDSADAAQREAYRRWYSATAEPLARVVEAELAAKLETPVSLDMTGLYAHDLVGRASAFQRLVGAGVSVSEALTTSGLLAADAEAA